MSKHCLILLLATSLHLTHGLPSSAKNSKDFFSDRAAMLAAEDASFLGAELLLNGIENIANDILMLSKASELDTAFQDSFYPPSQSFFNTKAQIQSSEVFAFIKGLPKGAALHIHDIAIASIDWVVANVTYRDNLYMCEDNSELHFGWFSTPDTSSCSAWTKVVDRRAQTDPAAFDAFLKSHLVINVPNPAESYPNINSVWSAFGSALGTVTEIINYEPILRDYFRQALEEFHQDNVQYLEVRTVLPTGVCSSLETCDPLSQLEVAALFRSVADEFANAHAEDTCGVNMIFAPTRRVTPEVVDGYLTLVQDLLRLFPGFFVGFDLVSQEDRGRPLIDFADRILNATASNPNLHFFFHAGETDWQGQPTDINIIDALLLGTKRIGHGYAIAKHPEAKQLAVERDVPIEVCPISNQVLGLVADLRNHPAAILIQEGFPLVISSDDPGTWDSFALSFDFYEAFMALAGKNMDLRLLKKLVFNSVRYSAMDEVAKTRCNDLVQAKWDAYMDTFVGGPDVSIVKRTAAVQEEELERDFVKYELE